MGNFRITLLGLPRSGDCLLASVLCQMQQVEGITPNIEQVYTQVSFLRSIVCRILHDRSRACDEEMAREFCRPDCIGDYEVVNILCHWLDVNIEIFKDDGNKRIYPAVHSGRPVLRVHRFQHDSHVYYDSVCSFIAHRLEILKLGSWNLSGATSIEKRMVIDELISHHQLDILCVQETHLYAQSLSTARYDWKLGPQTQSRASRGCGFIVSKSFQHKVEFESYSSNICQLTVTFGTNTKLFILCVHKMSEGDGRSSLETGRILSIMRNLISKGEVVLCGDMNSHIGKDMCSSIEPSILGEFLYHPESNSNGRDLYGMCEQLNLRVDTSMHHYSTRCTWYRSSGRSQIDHVITPIASKYTLASLRGRWTKYSDHKLITFQLRLPQQGERNPNG